MIARTKRGTSRIDSQKPSSHLRLRRLNTGQALSNDWQYTIRDGMHTIKKCFGASRVFVLAVRSAAVCCSMLRCVAVCCNVFQWVAACWSVLHRVKFKRGMDLF